MAIISSSFSCFLLLLLVLLLLFIPHTASIAFNLTEIGQQNQNRDINTTGFAYINKDGIQMTPNAIDSESDANQTVGRATYMTPLHLWDKASGELASFTTDFSFVIDSKESPDYGDGLTFFLTVENSVMVTGSSMGLPIHGYTNTTFNPFVAVEFDTFPNANWDPRNASGNLIGTHVGIDINSLASVASFKWLPNITDGRVSHAWIAYDSVSKNFSVSVTGFVNSTVVIQTLHHVIDLKSVLPEWVVFGFSAASGAFFEKNMVISWAFNSSDLKINENNPSPSLTSPDPAKRKKNMNLIVGLSVSITFMSVIVIAMCVWMKKTKKRKEEEEDFHVGMNNEFEMGTGPRRFSYRRLSQSTGNFSESKKLGEGGFGGVYKGFLKDSNTHVAVKRVSKTSKQGLKEYASEVTIISKLRHRNLVQLTGWCHEKGELLHVYEYMENGSLDMHLFKGKSLLTWETRYRIANGLASALLYLHEEWEQCVLHRDIKSSNVMLDSNFNAKLGDFGLAKLVDHEKDAHTATLAGTRGYMAPEYAVSGRASKESDVFSFGVVALEITCGRKPILHKAQENEIQLVEWVWESYGNGTLLEVVDPHLGLDYEEEEMKRLMMIGLWCVHPDSSYRPSMRQVIEVLNAKASLPILPSKKPVATYLFSDFSRISSLHGDTTSSIKNQSLNSTSFTGRS